MELRNGTKQKITPCLWLKDNAEEVVNFYLSVFKDAQILKVSYYGEYGTLATGMPPGHVLTILFELNGTLFTALNGGVYYPFTPNISFMVNCDTQEEIDHYWKSLSAGGTTEQCGWLKDKFGISWQIIPTELDVWMSDKKTGNLVMEAILKMTKLDIPTLKNAFENK